MMKARMPSNRYVDWLAKFWDRHDLADFEDQLELESSRGFKRGGTQCAKRKRWVQRGKYAVQVEVDVLYPADDCSGPCLDPKTVKWLDRVAKKAEEGDLAFLKKAGRVFELVSA